MSSHEFFGLGPQCRDTFGRIVQVDVEPISLVMIAHPPKDVVVYVAVELYVGFNAPIILHVGQGRVFVEHAAIPATHIVIGYLACVLHILLVKDFHGLLEEIVIYPRGFVPVLFGNELWYWVSMIVQDLMGGYSLRTVVALGFGLGLCLLFKVLIERLVIKESPGIVEFVIPCCFQLPHRLDQRIHLRISHQGQQCCIDARGVGVVCGVIVRCSPQRLCWFARRFATLALDHSLGWITYDQAADHGNPEENCSVY